MSSLLEMQVTYVIFITKAANENEVFLLECFAGEGFTKANKKGRVCPLLFEWGDLYPAAYTRGKPGTVKIYSTSGWLDLSGL